LDKGNPHLISANEYFFEPTAKTLVAQLLNAQKKNGDFTQKYYDQFN